MRVSNLKPGVLNPVYDAKIKGNYDMTTHMPEIFTANLRQPISPNQPVSILTNAGNPVSDDEIIGHIQNCMRDDIDVPEEDWVKTLFGMTLLNYNKASNLSVRNIFAVQAGTAANIPEPSPTVIYMEASDVIPISRKFLAGACDYDEYFATMAYYARVETLGFYFANEGCFDAFKTFVASNATVLTSNPNFPPDTAKLLGDFQTLKLDGLTESLTIRDNYADNNYDESFARVIVWMLLQYTKQVSIGEFGIMPFDLDELLCPRSLVFVNVEKHMHATPKQVSTEWDIIRQSLTNRINMVSNRQLSKLTATQRALQNMRHAAVSSANALANPHRAAAVRFKKTPPTSVDLTRYITMLFKKLTNVNKSENSYKAISMTFAKPNRRDPDDFNKQGKSVSTRYRPDIHIYIDTSGSISERNYQDAVKACIRMAKKLNVNLYFNSFSDTLSQCAKLRLRDRSVKQAYAEFQKVHKVTGGTDYVQIWEYINMSKKRQRELSVIITDFEWIPPSRFVRHPTNLYYAPCSNMDYKTIKYWAEEFINSMKHIAPDCRKKVLM